jgi:hypothetical protein
MKRYTPAYMARDREDGIDMVVEPDGEYVKYDEAESIIADLDARGAMEGDLCKNRITVLIEKMRDEWDSRDFRNECRIWESPFKVEAADEILSAIKKGDGK